MGGLKLLYENRKDLTPVLVKEAVEIFKSVFKNFNNWLLEIGQDVVDPIGPTGSSVYAERDFFEGRSQTYGDIDYLVSFPVSYSKDMTYTERRKRESESAKKYSDLFQEYLKCKRPDNVEVDLTLNGNPLMVIVQLPSGGFAQVDTVITHQPYVEWMKGRYTPERGVKGYITGNLYKSLGDFLILSIGTEGVVARTKNEVRVTSKSRAGVVYHSISTNFRTFFKDIADYLIDGEYVQDEILKLHHGLDPENVTVESFCYGIVGLSKTLEKANAANSKMLSEIYKSFVSNIEENVNRKVLRDISEEKESKLRKLNEIQSEKIQKIFGV
jgi:hypothetical protein